MTATVQRAIGASVDRLEGRLPVGGRRHQDPLSPILPKDFVS